MTVSQILYRSFVSVFSAKKGPHTDKRAKTKLPVGTNSLIPHVGGMKQLFSE
jgi:hypothetical protein